MGVNSRWILGLSVALFGILSPGSATAQQRGNTGPGLQVTFQPGSIGPGSVSTLRYSISNDSESPVTGLAFTNTLPTAVTLADPANASTTCSLAPGGALSAPDGGSTITLTGAEIGAATSCLVAVDVTSSTPGIHTNPSVTLTSDAGTSSSPPVDLTVDVSLPAFTKSFTPSTVALGARGTLTLTIDNTANASALSSLSFVDPFPPGLRVASPANSFTDCGGPTPTLSASPGSVEVGFSSFGIAFPGFEVLLAGASCTVTVDVVATTRGTLVNSSGELTSSTGSQTRSSGKASAALEVIAGDVHLTKSFLDDPVPPGGTVPLELTIRNFSRDQTAEAIGFTDDLNATLSGLAVGGALPLDPCGPGSSLSGTSTLTLSDGVLAPGASCTFTVELAVPLLATPGIYPNTSSPVSFDLGAGPETGLAASDSLFLFPAPVVTKTFLDSPVTAGDTTRVEFTITNTSPTSSATDITLSDPFPNVLPTATTTPGNGLCGLGSTSTFVPLINPPAPSDTIPATLTIEGGSLAPAGSAGDSCTFTITMDVAADAPTGTAINTTSAVTATVDDVTVTGNPATDSLAIVAAPSLSKSFKDDPVAPGGTVTLELELKYSPDAPADALDITFTDDLSAILAGLSAVGLPANDVCGAGSQLAGTTTLSLTGGALAPGETCLIEVTLQVPAGAPSGSYPNTTSAVSATVDGLAVSSNAAQDDLTVAELVFTKEFIDDPVIPGDTATLRFSIANLSPTLDATGMFFSDNLDSALAGLTAIGLPISDPCGAGSTLLALSANRQLSFNGGNLAPASSCTFDVTVQVPSGATDGTYPNSTTNLLVTLGGASVSLPGATDSLVVSGSLLSLTKTFLDNPAAPGDTVTLEFTLSNLDSTESVTSISFTDDLDAALSGLAAVVLPGTGFCGVGSQLSGTGLLSLSGGELAPGASCTFQAQLQIPANPATSQVVNVTSSVSGTLSSLAVTGDPATDTLRLQNTEFTKTFDGPTVVGGTARLSFTIQNLSGAESLSELSFFDDLDAALSGLEAVGTPIDDPCGDDSRLSGTGFLTFTGGSLGPSASCTFEVTVQLPAVAPPGTYPNTSSDLLIQGLSVGAPATADLTIEPPPTFDKAFAPDSIAAQDTSTLTLTVDNNASALTAVNLDFTDNLPAGLVVATPSFSSTTCTGGTLTAVAGSGVISYAGGAVAAGSSCIVSVDVTGSTPGIFVNTTSDLTSSSGNSGTAGATLTVLDDNGPEVTALSTPAGALAPCDSVRQPITRIGVTIADDFSAIVNADQPSSYLLVEAGPDGDFSTISCGRTPADDIVVPIDALVLTELDSRTLEAELGFGSPGLGAGLYRLLVCDTIEDGAGNALDGDGDMSPGGNFEIAFRADPLNLFENGHFDDCPTSLEPWIEVTSPPDTIMTGAAGTDDASGSPLSASSRFDHASLATSSLAQCVPWNVASDYTFEARLRLVAGTSGTASVTQRCEFFDGTGCGGASLGSSSQTTLIGQAGGLWQDSRSDVVAPSGALSALCGFSAEGLGIDPGFTLFVDDLVLSAPTLIFADGFESGDPSAWSSKVP